MPAAKDHTTQVHEGGSGADPEIREVLPSPPGGLLGLLKIKIPGTGDRSTVRREYSGNALTRRRLLELRRETEFGQWHLWFHGFTIVPFYAWLILSLASMRTGMFWQTVLIIAPALLAGPAFGVALARVMRGWSRRRILRSTTFHDPKSPPEAWVRRVPALLAGGFLLLWIGLSLAPPQQFIQNMLDLIVLPAMSMSVLGAGLLCDGLFTFEGDEIVCASCFAAAPIESGDTCPGCGRGLSELQRRMMGRPILRGRKVFIGAILLALVVVGLLVL